MPILQVVPENPVAHVHWPSPTAGVLVVTQVPPFWQGLPVQKGCLVAQVGPEKPGTQLHCRAFRVGLITQVPLFWQRLIPAGHGIGANVVVATVVVTTLVGGTLQYTPV